MWFEQQVRPRLRGHALLVRYADDVLAVFAEEQDARRVLEVLPKRLGKYGLTLHPEKTRLVRFERPDTRPPGGDGGPRTSFDLLGFTHFWGKSRKGNWVVKQKTMSARLSRTLKRISMWCSAHRHLPIKEQHAALCRKLRGHDGYYGITGNARALSLLRLLVRRIWQKWLNRRSWKTALTWARMNRLLEHSVYHSVKP